MAMNKADQQTRYSILQRLKQKGMPEMSPFPTPGTEEPQEDQDNLNSFGSELFSEEKAGEEDADLDAQEAATPKKKKLRRPVV